MLRPIPGLPENVVGFEAVGKVQADDYRQALDPAVSEAVDTSGKVRLLLVLGPEYEGYSPAAMWEDTKLGFHGRGSWERLALVTDHRAMADMVRAFAWLVHGEVRTYPVSELDEAKAWLAEAA